MDIELMLTKLEKITTYLREGKPNCEGIELTDPNLMDVDDLLDQIISHWEY